MRLCIDCRHHKHDAANPEYDRCGNPDVRVIDLVRGQHSMPYAKITRMQTQPCGPSGSLFDYDPGSSPVIEEDFYV